MAAIAGSGVYKAGPKPSLAVVEEGRHQNFWNTASPILKIEFVFKRNSQ